MVLVLILLLIVLFILHLNRIPYSYQRMSMRTALAKHRNFAIIAGRKPVQVQKED